MSKPIVIQPIPTQTTIWPLLADPITGNIVQPMIAQGFHKNPANLVAYVKDSGGNVTEGTRFPSRGILWVFLFDVTEDDYTLYVTEKKGGEACEPVSFTVIGQRPAYGDPNINWPGDEASIPQSFAAWGTANSPLTAGTMVGNAGATTNGTPVQQPTGPDTNWIMQFAVTDSPLQNTYVLTVTDNGGSASSTRLTLSPNPPVSSMPSGSPPPPGG
jgi:hypothetical protein